MNTEASHFDIFFSYARADNRDGKINQLVAAIEAEYARFFPGKTLHNFFDTQVIENGEDWRNRLYTSLKRSRIMISLLSANYLASPWCRREWQAWCDIERSRGWLSYMLQPIYYVEVPDSEARVEEFLRCREAFLRDITDYARSSGAKPDDRFEENECLAEVMSRQAVDLKPWYTDGEAALRREEIRARLEALAKGLGRKLALAERGEQSPTNIPRHNRQFCGRIHELKALRQCFAEGEYGLTPVLRGLGGEGKSALAFAYAHAFAYDYPGGRRFVCCEGVRDLGQCFIKLGEECGLELPPDSAADPEVAKAARFHKVWEWLTSRPTGRSLVILDNIDHADALSAASLHTYIKAVDAVHVLATTRCDKHAVGSGGLPIAVHTLPPRDSAMLLESFRPAADEHEQEHIRRLAVLLGGHALSLELAGAFVRANPQMSWREYAEALGGDLLAGLEETRAEASALVPYAGTRQEQIRHLVTPMLEGISGLEYQALLFASLLSPEDVVEEWVRAALVRLDPDAMRRKALTDPWTRIRKTLTGLCLWQEGPLPGIVRMHRLVREVLRQRALEGQGPEAGPDTLAQRVLLLHEAGHTAAQEYVDGQGTWKFHHFAAMSPTLRLWFAQAEWAQSVLPLPLLLYQHILRWSGRTEEALDVVLAGLAVASSLPDTLERERRLAAYRTLEGHIRRSRGDVDAARSLYGAAVAALKTQAETLPDDIKTLVQLAHALDYAGAAESAAGDVEAARALHHDALAMLEALARQGNDTRQEQAYTLDHLACALSMAGREQEAFACFKRALDIRAALLAAAPENRRVQRDVSVSLDFMADSLMQGGDSSLADHARQNTALEYYTRALEIAEKLCAFDPPNLTYQRDFSISLNKLGDMRTRAGEHALALELYSKALAVREGMLAQDKENMTLWFDRSTSHNKVGDALAALGRCDEALPQYQAALRIRRTLRAGMPGNARYMYGQALCLENMAKLSLRQSASEKTAQLFAEIRGIVHELLAEHTARHTHMHRSCHEMLARLHELEKLPPPPATA